MFVAVAYTGANQVMTSPDGITWTTRSSASNYWLSVCWSPELSLFVVVASSGTNRVMTSPDGINWTARSESEANAWTSVCWSPELSLFVAVSYTGTNRVMTSPNGITWTSRSVAYNSWRFVCWSSELSLFVAVANSGTNRVMTSPDGITWTARSVASNTWYSVCWSPELSIFVAVGTNRVMTSPDGITWTARSVASNAWYSVCWSPELSIFVALAVTGTNRVMSSPDGITWTSRLSATESNAWRSVCWSPELSIFVAVSDGGTNRVMTSNIGMPNSKSVVKALPTQMSVLPNGNVGIGTTDPIYKLHVHGSQIGVTYNSDRNYGIYIDMYNTSYGRIQTIRQGVGYNYNLALQPNGGNVGIGTTAPGYRLTVKTGTQYDGIVLTNESSQDLIKLGRESSSRSYIALYNGTSGKVRIDTGGDSYFTGGYVGINTNNPSVPLQVRGESRFTGTNVTSHFNYSTSENTYIRGGKTNSNVFICDHNTNGKVGIGTSGPTVKLHVYGWTTGSRLKDYTQDDGRMAHYSGDNVANNNMTGGQLGPGSWVGYTYRY